MSNSLKPHGFKACSLPGFFVHGTFQARILEWVAISSSRGSSWSRGQIHFFCVICTAGRFFTTEPPGEPPKEGLCCCKVYPILLWTGIDTGKEETLWLLLVPCESSSTSSKLQSSWDDTGPRESLSTSFYVSHGEKFLKCSLPISQGARDEWGVLKLQRAYRQQSTLTRPLNSCPHNFGFPRYYILLLTDTHATKVHYILLLIDLVSAVEKFN